MFFSKKQPETTQKPGTTPDPRETAAAMERQLACRMLYTGTLFTSSPRLDVVLVLRTVGHEEN